MTEQTAGATIVYRFGLLRPLENEFLVRDQMRAAHNYRNELVFIERHRRAAHRAILLAHGNTLAVEAAVQAADEACADAARACAAARSESRSRKVPAELAEALVKAKEHRKEAKKRFAEARAVARAATEPQLALADERAADLRRGARALTTAYWGSYLQIESADDQSRKDMPLYESGEPNDPRFVPWRGEGFVGVQLQGGLPVGALESDRRIQIVSAPLGPNADPKSKRSAIRQRHVLSMRIGSTGPGGRVPIWGRWPMVMHRSLPTDVVIKWARVQMRRVGPREEWYVCLTVETRDLRRPVPDGGAVAVDLGWRSMQKDGLRVGTYVGDDGESGYTMVPERVPSAIEKCESLASIRDKAFNETRGRLVEWMASSAHSGLPPWLTNATKTLMQWRSIQRLAALVRRWSGLRFAGDETVYALCEAWRYHDHHLWSWQENQRSSALRQRKDAFRVIASQLARRYQTLVLEDKLDLRTWAKKDPGDGGEHLRYQRAVAAPSEMREALINAFGGAKKGGRVVMVNQVNTTCECHACGSIEEWDKASKIDHTCGSCGAKWDQDINASKVMLKRLCERRGGAKAAGVARDDENGSDGEEIRGGRWAKAKAKRRERLAESAIARE